MNDRDVTKPTPQERLEEIADLKRSIATRDAEIARLKIEVSAARSWAAEVLSGKHAQEMNEARAEIERLINARAEDAKREARILEQNLNLRPQIARLKAERDHWKAAHTERGERVGERTREVLALRTERDELRRRVGEMSGALSDAADIVRGIGKVGIWNQYLDHWDALRNTSGDQS